MFIKGDVEQWNKTLNIVEPLITLSSNTRVHIIIVLVKGVARLYTKKTIVHQYYLIYWFSVKCVCTL